jgi:hypothetical protein
MAGRDIERVPVDEFNTNSAIVSGLNHSNLLRLGIKISPTAFPSSSSISPLAIVDGPRRINYEGMMYEGSVYVRMSLRTEESMERMGYNTRGLPSIGL